MANELHVFRGDVLAGCTFAKQEAVVVLLLAVNVTSHVGVFECHLHNILVTVFCALQTHLHVCAVVDRLNLLDRKLRQAWHSHLLSHKVYHVNSIFRVNMTSDIFVIRFSYVLLCVIKGKRAVEEVFGLLHDKLVVAHAAIGLAHGHILEELVAVAVFHNNLHRETSCSNTNGHHLHLLVQVYCHFLTAVAVIVSVNKKFRGAGIESGTHQQFAGLVHIAKISQCRHAKLQVAVVVKRTVGNRVVVVVVVVFAVKVHECGTILGHTMPLIHHNLVFQFSAAYVAVGFCVTKRSHHQVILLRHDHKSHAFRPVAKFYVLEVRTDEVSGFFGSLFSSLFVCGHG